MARKALAAVSIALLSLGAAVATEPVRWAGLAAAAWPILYTGVLSVGIAFTAQVVAQRYAHAADAAIILSALPAQVAADAVAGLDEAVQADLLFRTATLGPVTAAAITDIEAILANYAESSASNPLIKLGGHGDVAKIVNNLARPQAAKLLNTIRKKDKILADAIEEGMFIFADLAQLDTKSLGAVIRNVDADRLALAIKGADAALSEKMLRRLSARKAQSISNEIAEMGPVSPADVEEAQKAVVAIAKGMAASGQIMLGKQSNNYV